MGHLHPARGDVAQGLAEHVEDLRDPVTALLIDALTELGGLTITVRHPLEPAAMRLMGTLGVTVVVDPAAPECEHWEVAFRGVIPHRCMRCEAVQAARVKPRKP